MKRYLMEWAMAYCAALGKYAGMASHPDTGRDGTQRAADLAERDANEFVARLEKRFGEEVCPKCEAPAPLESAHECAELSELQKMECALVAADAEREAQRQRADRLESELAAVSKSNELHASRADKTEAEKTEVLKALRYANDRLTALERTPALLKEALQGLEWVAPLFKEKVRGVIERARREGYSSGESSTGSALETLEEGRMTDESLRAFILGGDKYENRQPVYREVWRARGREEVLFLALRGLEQCVGWSDTMQCWVLTGNERTRPALDLARRALTPPLNQEPK